MKVITIIPTFNNAEHILETIKSAKAIGQVAIIDSGSTDDTKAIAEKEGCYFYERKIIPWDAGDQRNFAYSLWKNNYDWVLFLDSDEIISEVLANEIKQTICTSNYNYYSIRSQYHLFRKKLESISFNTFHDRLVSTDLNTDIFTSSPGEVFNLEDRNQIGKLKHSYIHNVDAKGFLDWVLRIFQYSFQNGFIDVKNIKEKKLRRTKNYGFVRRYRIIFLFSLPILYFFYYIFVRKCLKDGFVGLMFALIMSLAYLSYPFGFIKGLFSAK